MPENFLTASLYASVHLARSLTGVTTPPAMRARSGMAATLTLASSMACSATSATSGSAAGAVWASGSTTGATVASGWVAGMITSFSFHSGIVVTPSRRSLASRFLTAVGRFPQVSETSQPEGADLNATAAVNWRCPIFATWIVTVGLTVRVVVIGWLPVRVTAQSSCCLGNIG